MTFSFLCISLLCLLGPLPEILFLEREREEREREERERGEEREEKKRKEERERKRNLRNCQCLCSNELGMCPTWFFNTKRI